MHRAIRTQVDDKFDAYSVLTSLPFTGPDAKDETRQEFKRDADINYILARYTATGSIPLRDGRIGDIDFGMDLQQAIHAVDSAKRMYQKLPENLRQKYGTWTALLNALQTGELQLDLNQDADEKKAAAEVAAALRADPTIEILRRDPPDSEPEISEPNPPATRGRKVK